MRRWPASIETRCKACHEMYLLVMMRGDVRFAVGRVAATAVVGAVGLSLSQAMLPRCTQREATGFTFRRRIDSIVIYFHTRGGAA